MKASSSLNSLKYRLKQIYDAVETEFNFRFNRKKILSEMEKLRKIPRNLHIEGTNICNAKCSFCAYPQMQRIKATMPMELFRNAVDQYIAMGGHGVSLTPIVGDPFVDRYIFERLDYLDSKPEIHGFYFYTNGILMKPNISKKLLKYGEKLHIYVSFGGFDQETYKSIMGVDYFDLVSRNIEEFFKQKELTQSKTFFTLALRCPPSNWHGEFWTLCKQLQQQGLLKMNFVQNFDSWAGKIEAIDLENVGLQPTLPPYKRGACELLFNKPIILANGQVNACACRDVEAELVIGDLNQVPLSQVWSGQGIDEIIERHELGEFPEVCRRCTWYTSIYNTRNRNLRIHKEAQLWDD